jgi:signal peptidase I
MAKSSSSRAASGRDRSRVRSQTRAKTKSRTREYVEAVLIAVILALVFRQFVIQAFRIPSGSMEKTLLVGDFLFVNKFLYGAKLPWTDIRLPAVRQPQRGDIIVFKSPSDGRDFIKRCVAVAGDTLELRGTELYINGELQDEPYAQYVRHGRRGVFGPIVVPEGHLFMMGDNRDNSQDSRVWGFLPLHMVKGKAMFIYFSVEDWFPPHLRLSRIGDILR